MIGVFSSSGMLAAAMATAVCAHCEPGPAVVVRSVTNAQPGALLIVDGKLLDAESLQMVRGQQVMVSLRDLEKLGWGVVSAGLPNQVVFKAKGVTLSFTKGQSVAMVNSLPVKLPVDPIREGRLMVPLSFVAKALGYDYECVSKACCHYCNQPREARAKVTNSLHGTVIYDGVGMAGIKVRAVDPTFKVVDDAMVTTDSEGNFEIKDLPTSATWLMYTSTTTRISSTALPRWQRLRAVRSRNSSRFPLGRIITPVSPKPSEVIAFGWRGISFFVERVQGRGFV